jgi:threonine aldolase
MQHCYRWEGGGAAVFGSVQPQPLAHQADGTLALADIEAAIKPDDPHFARTRLLALENTLGGKVMPLAYLDEATALARSRGLATHLDGARLFNAAVATASRAAIAPAPSVGSSGAGSSALASQTPTDIPNARAAARRIAGAFDSVSVCFSKGLGAPVGSALCGSKDFIARARRIRKMAGGAMRQAGVIAAAASYALDHHIDRLAQDHALAQRLAHGLEGFPGLKIEAPDTNILFVDLTGDAREKSNELLAHLKQQGVLATGLYRLRFVTHLDVDAEGIDRAIAAIRSFFRA